MKNFIYIRPQENEKEFTTFCFYNSFLPQLQLHYKESKEPPVFSFEGLQRISPLVLPNLLGIGYYLSKYHKEPIELLLSYEPKLLYYLFSTDFFRISALQTAINPKGLNIYNFDQRFIGGFSEYINKYQRKEHKVHYYIPINTSVDDMNSHDELMEDLTLFTLPNQFETVLMDTIPEKSIPKSIESIAEPISNGILHSKSITWAISQTTPLPYSKTVLSIVDVGIGFEESIKRKGIEKVIISKVKKMGYHKDYLNDYFFIMEALHFSMLKNRYGLIDFIFRVAESGTVRIHYNSTQILFTPRLLNKAYSLRECRKKIIKEFEENDTISSSLKKKVITEIINLSQSLLDLFNNDKQYSSIRIYSVIFKGVHIEFELPKI